MQNNLVTSYIRETFDKDSNNILLGNWCKPPNGDQILYRDSEIIKYHFDNHTKLENDRKYLCDLFYKILKNLTVYMNNFHEEKRPERYWHIVLGPWLVNQISILWDRWESLALSAPPGPEGSVFPSALAFSSAALTRRSSS